MELVTTHDRPKPVDKSGLAERVLDLASRTSISIVTVECHSGGGVSALLNAADRNRQQFGGGYLINSAQALREMLGLELVVGSGNNAQRAALAVEMSRSALRRSRAGIALAVVAPPNRRTSGRVHFAVADRCDHYWADSVDLAGSFPPDIAARGLTFLATCIEKSEATHF